MGLTLFFFPALILFLVSFSYQHHDHIHTSFVKIVCFIGVFFNLFAPLYILIVFPTTPKNVLTVSKIRNNLVHESFHISQENLPVYSASDLLQTPHTKGLTLSFKPASGTNFKTVASDEYNSQPRNEIDKNFSVYGDTVADSVRNSYRKYDKIVPIHSAEQARSEKSTNTVATPYHSRIIKK
jgi:hypothetical protein